MMKSISFTRACLLVLVGLFCHAVVTDARVVTKEKGAATRQARDFQRIVNTLIGIVDDIRKDGQSHRVTDGANTSSDDAPTGDGQIDDVPADDPRTDRARTDNARTDGARTDDTRTDETQPDAAQTDDAVTNNSQTDGAQTDDSQINGAQTDDAQTDDSQIDGAKTDDAVTDDAQTDGAQTDDAVTNNAQTDDAQTDEDVTNNAQINNIKQSPTEASESIPTQETPQSPELVTDKVPYKLHIVEPLSGKANAAVIILHGLGQNVETLLPVAHAIAFTGLPNVRFILPEAPKQHVTFIDKTVPSWFDITSTDPSHPENRDEILQAAAYIAAISQQQTRDHGIPANRIAVLGISQGGALALTAYLRYRWAGVMTVSSWLPLRNTYPKEMTNDSDHADLVMLHGADDRIIPKEWARLSASLIKKWGRNVSYVEIQGEGHWLSSQHLRSGDVDTVFNTALTALQKALS